MSIPRFLLDIDGVCADFLGAALPVIRDLTGKPYVPEDFSTWDLFDVVPKEYEEPFYERCRAPGFCIGLQPYPGAVEGVTALQNMAAVRVVTSPIHGPAWYYERSEWCATHLSIAPRHVIHKHEKWTEHGDYLLDDKPAHVANWAKAHPHGIGLLWDQPYNRTSEIEVSLPNVRRVSTWEQVHLIVRPWTMRPYHSTEHRP